MFEHSQFGGSGQADGIHGQGLANGLHRRLGSACGRGYGGYSGMRAGPTGLGAAWMRGRFVPYPVQRNLRHFPIAERDAAPAGLEAVASAASVDITFEDHLRNNFGTGLYVSFLNR